MRRSILIDASHWGTSQPTGVETYVDSLLPHLLSELPKRGFHRVHLISPNPEPPIELPEYAHWYHVPYRRYWGQYAVLESQKRLKPSLYFTPSGIPALDSLCPTVFTIHDLSIHKFPSAYSIKERFRTHMYIRSAAKQAKQICVPSSYVETELMKAWHIPSDKIKVTPLALPERETKVAPQAPAWVNFEEYILYVGRLEKKKNLEPLMEGFAALKDMPELRLILAGFEGYGAEQVRKFHAKLPEGVRKRIYFPGYIGSAEKQWLYDHASLCAVPSPYEGFGLPVLEAFAAQVPVVCAAEGAVAEVADGAGILVAPFERESWREALYTGLTDRALRKKVRYAGLERLTQFSWEAAASQTIDAFLAATTSK